jgi:molybdate transport system ATP-binding protein
MITIDVRLPLEHFDLAVAAELRGRAVGLLGPSGSGKTSLLEAIAGLRRGVTGRIVREGEVLLDSAKGVRLPPERRRLGYVPQESLLFPHLSVEENVRYAMRGGSEEVFRDAVEILEIVPLLPRAPATLSGGERQRVALARAIASRPRLLLLDEPLAGVDVALRGRIVPYLLRIRDELAIPFLYVTHNTGEAALLLEEGLWLERGRLRATGPIGRVLEESARVGGDSGAVIENLFAGTLEELARDGVRGFRVGDARLFVPDPGHTGRGVYAVAPSDVLLAAAALPAVSARNVLEGMVSSARDAGGLRLVSVEASGLAWTVSLTAAAAAELGLEPGRRVWLAVKAAAFRPLS